MYVQNQDMYVQNQDMYVQNQDMYVQNQDMYVQNQDMYVQNQDMYVQNQAFCFRKCTMLRIIGQWIVFLYTKCKISKRNETDCVMGILGILDPLNRKNLQFLGKNDKIPIS